MTNHPRERERRVQTLWQHTTKNDEMRVFRRAMKWSLNKFAAKMDYSRDYIKKLLRKRKPFKVTPAVEARFRALQATAAPALAEQSKPKARVIISRYRIPHEVHNYIRVRRCRGHNRWSMMAPNQVYCGSTQRERAACQKLWRRKQHDNRHSRGRTNSTHAPRARRTRGRVSRGARRVGVGATTGRQRALPGK